jgi:hypothetical protein
MEHSIVMPPGQPVLGDKGYELFVDGKWWPLGSNKDCQIVAGAVDHWRQRLETLDEEISDLRTRFEALANVFDAPATPKTEQQAKLERELLCLGRVRTAHAETLSVLEQCQTEGVPTLAFGVANAGSSVP